MKCEVFKGKDLKELKKEALESTGLKDLVAKVK